MKWWEMKLIVRMPKDFDKGHAPSARNVPYYLSVTPQGQFLDQSAKGKSVARCSFFLRLIVLLPVLSYSLSLGKEKNPLFVEEVAALCAKDDTFIVVSHS